MTALARRERAALADLLDAVGPDAPTLCAGWAAYDLAAHLVLRESSPLAALGIAVPALERLTDTGMRRLKTTYAFAELVRAFREGPPWYSPLRPPRVDASANAMELFIHHEDVRRAGGAADGARDDLDARDQQLLWNALARTGRLLARKAPVGIELVRTDVARTVRISKGEPTLVVRGLPGELALFAHGRGTVADVELGGDDAARAVVSSDQLGL